MRSFLGDVFVLILMSFHEGHATRYLPSIVWDHLNPMLSCKCNWFHPMTMMEIYDRFEFVCPTQKITVKLLDTYSRPDDQMNLNLFQRKWKGGHNEEGINKLKRQMMNGSFCDPESSETKRIHQCKNGKDCQGKTIRFARDTSFYKDDIVVFFNNGNDGRESTLSSKEKRCAMALVVKLTWGVAMKYDFTYRKNLTADKSRCDNANATCEPEENCREITSTTPPPSTSTTPPPFTSTTPPPSTSTTPPPSTSTTPPSPAASFSERSSSESWDSFKYGVLVGLAIALLLNCFIGVSYFFICSKSKQEKKSGHGVSNVAYQPQTLQRGSRRI